MGVGGEGRGERVVLDSMFTSSLKSFTFSLCFGVSASKINSEKCCLVI